MSEGPTPEEVAVSWFRSESAMWLRAGSNYEQHRIDVFRQHYDDYVAAGGKTHGKP